MSFNNIETIETSGQMSKAAQSANKLLLQDANSAILDKLSKIQSFRSACSTCGC